VKSVVDALREARLLDNTVVIVTADHGESFYDHSQWGHGGALYEEQVRVPLILWAGERIRRAEPRIPRGVQDVPVCTVDVMPTLLSLANVACPTCVGESILTLAARGRRTRPIYMEEYMEPGNYAYAMVDESRVLMFSSFYRGRWNRWEQYDLRKDAGQTINLLHGPPDSTTPLFDQFASIRRKVDSKDRQARLVNLGRSPTLLQELTALGYVK
jgi:arylsulfatase A-like enzyme